MLNWIVWNETVFGLVTVLLLNWIVLIRTVWLNWIAWNWNVFYNWIVYFAKPELFEIELFLYIKIDLALNNLRRLICH